MTSCAPPPQTCVQGSLWALPWKLSDTFEKADGAQVPRVGAHDDGVDRSPKGADDLRHPAVHLGVRIVGQSGNVAPRPAPGRKLVPPPPKKEFSGEILCRILQTKQQTPAICWWLGTKSIEKTRWTLSSTPSATNEQPLYTSNPHLKATIRIVSPTHKQRGGLWRGGEVFTHHLLQGVIPLANSHRHKVLAPWLQNN